LSVLLEPRRAEYPDEGGGERRPALVWPLPPGTVAIASAVLGGGLGPREWVLNAQVGLDYAHADPDCHVASIASGLGLRPACGVGLLTAASVLDVAVAAEAGVECAATVGLSAPTWAAAAEEATSSWSAGTINLVCWVPAELCGAALVNAVITATEAKSQCLGEAGLAGTGTASDAIVVCSPAGGSERYGGPRSRWGSRLARAVHRAVTAGTATYLAGPR